MAAATDCEHEGFTCQKECRLLRQRRRRQKAAGQRAAGLTPTSAVDAGHEKLFAVGAFGAKDARGGLLDGFGLLCSDGSRTAIAGAPRPAPTAWPVPHPPPSLVRVPLAWCAPRLFALAWCAALCARPSPHACRPRPQRGVT